MQRFRVLIVDDSAVIRKVLSGLLASDPEIEVVGTAGNGIQALARIPETKPDLVTLDIEMPVMNGLETLVEIRKLYPKLPVIMFSTLTERGATATLDALARGASDYVTKPGHGGGSESSREVVREELIRKIKSLCAVRAPQPRVLPAPQLARPSNRPRARIDVVAIGSSTGGPNALTAHSSATRCRFSRADRDCAAHASSIYASARRTSQCARAAECARRKRRAKITARPDLDCAGRQSHDGGSQGS